MKEKREVLRLKPEIKEFVMTCRLMRYILLAFGITFGMAFMIVALFAGDARFDAEMWNFTFMMTVFMDGCLLILGTLADMAICLIGWFIKHRIKFNKIITVEERNIKII